LLECEHAACQASVSLTVSAARAADAGGPAAVRLHPAERPAAVGVPDKQRQRRLWHHILSARPRGLRPPPGACIVSTSLAMSLIASQVPVRPTRRHALAQSHPVADLFYMAVQPLLFVSIRLVTPWHPLATPVAGRRLTQPRALTHVHARQHPGQQRALSPVALLAAARGLPRAGPRGAALAGARVDDLGARAVQRLVHAPRALAALDSVLPHPTQTQPALVLFGLADQH